MEEKRIRKEEERVKDVSLSDPSISHLAQGSCSTHSGFPWQDMAEPRRMNGGDIVKDTSEEELTVLMTMARKR